MPDTQSQEKIDLLRVLGAEVRPVPAVPFDDPANYNHQAKAHAERLDNGAGARAGGQGRCGRALTRAAAVWTNQFDNVANRDGHEATTGPEIWEQTGGKVDAFTCATGTGGTLAGAHRALRGRCVRARSQVADRAHAACVCARCRGVPFSQVTEREREGVPRRPAGQVSSAAGAGGERVAHALLAACCTRTWRARAR